MTPMAALLLQWVIITSPDFMRLAPIFAIVATALEDISTNSSELDTTRSLASWRVDTKDSPLIVALTPFQRETAVGRDAVRIAAFFLMSRRKSSKEVPL